MDSTVDSSCSRLDLSSSHLQHRTQRRVNNDRAPREAQHRLMSPLWGWFSHLWFQNVLDSGGSDPAPPLSVFVFLFLCMVFTTPGPQIKSKELSSTLLQILLMNSLAHCTRASVSMNTVRVGGLFLLHPEFLSVMEFLWSQMSDEEDSDDSGIRIPFPSRAFLYFEKSWVQSCAHAFLTLPPSAAVYTSTQFRGVNSTKDVPPAGLIDIKLPSWNCDYHINPFIRVLMRLQF